ncbi:hypothetical protein AYX22_04750 [Arthrobacter sp. D5-1]|nr:hypothetical protein AYX22_04750 [Arthrobacter sp. D5-1]
MGEIEDPLGFDHADDLFFGHGLCSAFPSGGFPGRQDLDGTGALKHFENLGKCSIFPPLSWAAQSRT